MKNTNEEKQKNQTNEYDANKTSAAETVESKKLSSIKLTKKEEMTKFVLFVLFSLSAGIIQILCFTLLFEVVHLSYWPSYLIALILSVLYNFTINRKFTFKSANNMALAMLQILIYYVVFTPLSTWWGEALTNTGWNEYLVLIGTMIINMVTEFLVCRFVVYRKSINSVQNPVKK